jgi:hypothetical protein
MESAEEAGYSFGETLARIVGYALERKVEIEKDRERRRIEREKKKPASPESVAATLDGVPTDEVTVSEAERTEVVEDGQGPSRD